MTIATPASAPPWVRRALSSAYPGARIETLVRAETRLAGDGLASTADRIAFAVTYAHRPERAPAALLYKTIDLPRGAHVGPRQISILSRALGALDRGGGRAWLRARAFDALTRFQERFPQAPAAMYETEVRFYREVRPELTLETPRVFDVRFDPASRRFGILMEDLRARDARFPTALDTTAPSEIAGLLETLAGLHARFYRAPSLHEALAWVPTPLEGGMQPVFAGLGAGLIEAQLRLYPFKRKTLGPRLARFEHLWKTMWRHERSLARGPMTLLHGDPHIANTYLLPSRAGGLVDWQLMMRGHPMRDVAYVMSTGLSISDRRRHERDLVAGYRRALIAHGVDAPPLETLMEDHRLALAWGLVIGWLITPPQNYGQAITQANLERMAAAVRDHRTFEVA